MEDGLRGSGIVCKGSMALGSGCGRCDRCETEKEGHRDVLRALATGQRIQFAPVAPSRILEFTLFVDGRVIVGQRVVVDNELGKAWAPSLATLAAEQLLRNWIPMVASAIYEVGRNAAEEG